MVLVCRAILALIVDLLVCYLWGEAVLGNFYKRICHPLANLLVGFLLGQGVFQIITLGCYFAGQGLAQVIALWGICAGIMCIWGAYTRIKSGKAHAVTGVDQSGATGQERPGMILKMGAGDVAAVVLAGVTVLAFCYYVCINGELNEDSRYYVGLVNVTMNTGTLFQYNAFNGVMGDSWYLRRALATYEIHSAALGTIFHLPAILVTRYMRAWENVILSSGAVYLFGSRILWRENEEGDRKSCYLVALYLLFQLVYSRSYSSSATFFLIRAYEGKALVANALVIGTLYLCAEYIRGREHRMLFLLAFALWGATAVSSSGMVVIAAEMILLLGAGLILRMTQKRGRADGEI